MSKSFWGISLVALCFVSCGGGEKNEQEKVVTEPEQLAQFAEEKELLELYIEQFKTYAEPGNMQQMLDCLDDLKDNLDDKTTLSELNRMRCKRQIDSLDHVVATLVDAEVRNMPLCIVDQQDTMVESSVIIPVSAKKGDKLYFDIRMPNKGAVRFYNGHTYQLQKSYNKVSSVVDSLPIANSAIYLIEVAPSSVQYVDIKIEQSVTEVERLLSPEKVISEECESRKGELGARAITGVQMKSLFDEPRKFTLRGQLKAMFSGSYRALVPLQVPAGAEDVMYSLRISTNEGDVSKDGKFYDNMCTSYSKVKFLGLPLYEGQHGSGLLNTLLGENMPVRDEDAYINMYVFFNAGEARKFQDGESTANLKYHVDYSIMGTQSCNGRIPSRGCKTVYLGFENERMRYNNYVWLEGISAVPSTEYVKTKYSVCR